MQIFLKMKNDLRSWRTTLMLWKGCVAFLVSDLMTTLTNVLMDNFCPCLQFWIDSWYTIKVGYYFPDVSSSFKYYNGTILEEEYEKKLMVSCSFFLRVNGLAQNVSTLKYCSTLEIVFVHFREDFENFSIFTVPVDLAKNQSLWSKTKIYIDK